MRNITFVALLLAAVTCVFGDNSFEPIRQQELLISPFDSAKVPGKNPVEICSLSPSDDLVEIKYIDVTPNPPQPGKNMTVEGMALLKTDIREGAYANFEVKYGFIKLLSGTADLCEKAEEVQLKCPIEKGQISVEKIVQLPSQIPPVSLF